MADRSGNIWLASFDGLLQFNTATKIFTANHFKYADTLNRRYNNLFMNLYADPADENILWCGTWGAGLARFDGKTWRNFTTADGLPANHIFMLYLDPQGKLWAGTNRGLARLNDDGKSFTVMTTADGLYADNVFSMTNAADGSLWIGSFGGVAHLVAQQ